MQKLLITIDLAKIDKSRIHERSYENRDGQTITQKLYDIEAVELSPDQQKLITEGPTWKLMKTHFVVNAATKEERENRVKTATLGEGKQFINEGEPFMQRDDVQTAPADLDNEIPF